MKADIAYVRRVPAPPGAPYRHLLAPADDRSAALFDKARPDELVAIRLMRGRSIPQHRLFWAILSHVAEASSFEHAERLLVALKLRLGRYDLMAMPNGKVVPVPDSISFAEMPQDAFQRFFDDSLRVICAEVLPGVNAADLVSEVQAMIGASPAALQTERAA